MEKSTSLTKKEFETAEDKLIERLGVSWTRQNSGLTVHLYKPKFKVETLLPVDNSYIAHAVVGDSWPKLVALEAENEHLKELVQHAISCMDRSCVRCNIAMKEFTKEPPVSLIDSMAMRYNHGFGLLPPDQQENIRTKMRQLWEEISGHGFWHPNWTLPVSSPQMPPQEEM